DPIRLEMPVGSYEPVFVRRGSSTSESSEAARPAVVLSPGVKRQFWKTPVALLTLLGLGLVALVVFLLVSNRSLQRQVNEVSLVVDGSAYGSVWQPFFKSSEQTLVVLSNPPVYRFSNPVDPAAETAHSVGLTGQQVIEASNALRDKPVVKQNHDLRLVLSA